MNKPLHLILKKEWFDKIENGTKTIEYREKTPYWDNRLKKSFSTVLFQLGYSKDAKRMTAQIKKIQVEIISHPFFGNQPIEVYAIYICNPKIARNGEIKQIKR